MLDVTATSAQEARTILDSINGELEVMEESRDRLRAFKEVDQKNRAARYVLSEKVQSYLTVLSFYFMYLREIGSGGGCREDFKDRGRCQESRPGAGRGYRNCREDKG